MKKINKNLRTQTTALTLFLESGLSIYIGILMICDYIFFVSQVKTIIFVYFIVVLSMNSIQLFTGFKKGVRQIIQNLFVILGASVALIFLYQNMERIVFNLSRIMCMWTFLLGVCSLISFVQYHREKSSAPFRYLLSACVHMVFSILLLRYFTNFRLVGMRVIGIYFVLLGATLCIDGLSQAIPERNINTWKNRVRIALPAYIAAFIPLRVLNRMNEYLKKNPEEEVELKIQKGEEKSNIQILVHVSKLLKGTTGHVDVVVDGVIYCYGTYDRESMKLGGVVGTGVLYEVYNIEEYLEYCKTEKEETIFEFGIALQEEELHRVKQYISAMKARTKIWKCKAQRAEEAGENTECFQEPACKLSKATRTVFYKFKNGSYKYYWFLGTNCVKFTDDILRSSGMKTILTGIVTPGTYFSFLNDMFIKEDGNVVSRTIHYAMDEEI